MGLPEETGPEPQSKASQSFKQGMWMCSSSGGSVEKGSGTARLEEEAVRRATAKEWALKTLGRDGMTQMGGWQGQHAPRPSSKPSPDLACGFFVP